MARFQVGDHRSRKGATSRYITTEIIAQERRGYL